MLQDPNDEDTKGREQYNAHEEVIFKELESNRINYKLGKDFSSFIPPDRRQLWHELNNIENWRVCLYKLIKTYIKLDSLHHLYKEDYSPQ